MSMTRTLPLPAGAMWLLLLMLVQLGCAGLFIVFFVVDVAGLSATPSSYTMREIVQVAAGAGLLLSIVLNGFLFHSILRRNAALEQGLRAARGAFHELITAEFQKWMLSRAEAEVALLAIKGYSNAEIASLTNKSEGTVKSQSNAVFRKAGVSGRVQLMSHFMEELMDEALTPETVDPQDKQERGGGAPARSPRAA